MRVFSARLGARSDLSSSSSIGQSKTAAASVTHAFATLFTVFLHVVHRCAGPLCRVARYASAAGITRSLAVAEKPRDAAYYLGTAVSVKVAKVTLAMHALSLCTAYWTRYKGTDYHLDGDISLLLSHAHNLLIQTSFHVFVS